MSPVPAAVALDDKYVNTTGRVLISGIQALVRLTLEQRRIDQALGLNTAAFVSGYQGSPLGGVDLEMARAARFLEPAGVVFRPGVNEELAATAVAGTQLLEQAPGRRYDGVAGFWYGKNPGLDRAADAIRHGIVAGTAAHGGAVAWIGDDPGSKSSTVPSSCEQMCQSLSMPLLAPGSVAEILEFGLHAVALSRASGLWTGLKIVADIADASATVDLDTLAAVRAAIGLPRRPPTGKRPVLLGPASLDAEHDMLTRRLDLARAYASDAQLNRVTLDSPGATLGIVASGTSYAVVQRALHDLGLDEPALNYLGLRLIRLAMPFPLDAGALAELTSGLDRVLVVEDKTPFLEGHLKEALYSLDGAPQIVGRFDGANQPLLTARGTLGAEDVAAAIARVLGPDRLPRSASAKLHSLSAPPPQARLSLPTVAPRTPYFCSGCPHSTSTRASDETLVGVGIGCHAMVALDGVGRGRQLGLTQMGGEGAQWIGLAPFTDDRHFVQNLGDGTFHHSGSLAVRAAVAAGVTMTYKLLYNDAVAMTGGQRAEGRMDVPALTRLLAIEGVRRIIITTPEPAGYNGVALDPIASVRHRDDFAASEAELAATAGVTVLIHDDQCAAEQRRLRKRGKLPTPPEKIVINERVCEGCGDCGDISTCLSVQPISTEFGRKTRIHQASCNSDLSCLKGDCPSFLLVTPGTAREHRVPAPPSDLPEPHRRVDSADVLIRMTGIGGTGVVTVSQILQMAAHLDGGHAAGLEQTGLAQKGGPVVSDVRISDTRIVGALRASRSTADVVIGFDVLGAGSDANLDVAASETIAIVNTALVPTAAMVTNRVAAPGTVADAVQRIDARMGGGVNLYLDAQEIAETVFRDHMPTNMVLVGAAFQHGCIPLAAGAVEQAIRLNGASVDKTLAAFRWGRAVVAAPDAVAALLSGPAPAPSEHDRAALAITAAAGVPAGLAKLVGTRVADLIGFQDEALARRYAVDVASVSSIVAQRTPADEAETIVAAYARNLHKLMAYKDEYEVARLHLDAVERARVTERFGADAKVVVLLHPPILRALGMKRKLRLRRMATISFRVLRASRRLRGTRLDPFGYAHMRKTERALIGEYRTLVSNALAQLGPDTIEAVREIAELPADIRGYEHLKSDRVDQFRRRAETAIAELAK